jgi:lipid kinase YegS
MPQSRRFVVVVHGERAEQPAVRELIDRLRDLGHAAEPRISLTAGDAITHARDAAAESPDAVLALGGDGTVNEVLNGLDGYDVPLGIVPFGTANDFARQVGIPLDPEHALDVILGCKPTRIDTAELNGRRFLNVSTGGVGAEATAETPDEAKAQLGFVAYAITGVRKLAELEPRRARFTAPGLSLDAEFLLFAVGNARATGAGTLITPEARLDDGLLDLCIVESMPRAEFARLLFRIKAGEHLSHPGVRYVQVPEVRIESDTTISVNVDGEPADAARLHYRARVGDLRIFVPVPLSLDQGRSTALPGEDRATVAE